MNRMIAPLEPLSGFWKRTILAEIATRSVFSREEVDAAYEVCGSFDLIVMACDYSFSNGIPSLKSSLQIVSQLNATREREKKVSEITKPGDECPNCKTSGHTGVWDHNFWLICPVCGDSGVLDEEGIEILAMIVKGNHT